MKSVAITVSCFSCHDNEKNLSYDYRDYQYTRGPGDKVGVGYNCERRRSEITIVIQPTFCDVHAYVYCIALLLLIIYYRWLV